mmetsp:Transcript_115199/g.358758  ORF Transcript_115199/g.358758 Transcript_115199/m.358758 type:complete len:237 (-) Transcript_115199:3-713(-)
MCAWCCSATSFLSAVVCSRKASSAAVCRASVCDTRTSSLSSLARTSFTSTQSALSFRASSTMVLSAFFANSPLRASRWPMKMSSAMVSRYFRRSASFLRTVLYSAQFTFLEMRFSSSDTSSRLENIARHFRFESWKASSSRCSNSWKARPIARRKSVSEIMLFMPLSICETTSCCWRVVLCSLLMPCSSVNIFFLLKLCSAMGSLHPSYSAICHSWLPGVAGTSARSSACTLDMGR